MKWTGAIFDFDGVIFDSEHAVHKAGNAVLKEHKLNEVSAEEFRKRKGNDWEWYERRGVSVPHKDIRNLFYQHFDRRSCGVTRNIRAVLHEFSTGNIPCGIVSAHNKDELVETLDRFRLRHYFKEVVGDTLHKKEMLEHLCERFSSPPSQTLFIGDLASDMEHGNKAELVTVLLAPPDYPHTEDAHHHIHELRELLYFLK